MATITMMQGDSFVVFFDITNNGKFLTPDDIADLEVSVGELVRKTLSGGTVGYDTQKNKWYIRPTQEETLAMEPNTYSVVARVKFSDSVDSDVKGVNIGRMFIIKSSSKEVI